MNEDEILNIRAMLEQHMMAVKRAQVVRHLGWSVTRIVNRIDTVSEGNLDLSQCQLVQLPDAVYFLMRHTPIVSCNLSSNVISKIPAKLSSKFATLKHLDLSANKLSSLPANMVDMADLESVDISNNIFSEIPHCLLAAPQVTTIVARHNQIRAVDIEMLLQAPSLKILDIRDNPVDRLTETTLLDMLAKRETKIQILMSERHVEEWEDLTI